MKRYLPFLIIALVLLIAVGGALFLFKQPSAQPAPGSLATAPPTNVPAAAPPAALPEEQPLHFKGDPHAAVRLEEFGDYQCPPCGNFHPIAQQIMAAYGPRVRFAFRNFPLLTAHKNAFLAAKAAEAAGLQDKFWEMHDLLYEKQLEWSKLDDPRPQFMQYAQRVGVDMNRFAQDLDGSMAAMRVAHDVELGRLRGVSGTPTLYLNGREVPFEQIMEVPKLRAVIDAALAGQQ